MRDLIAYVFYQEMKYVMLLFFYQLIDLDVFAARHVCFD